MGNIVNLVVQLVGGGLGGVGAGKVFPKISLGNVGNIIAGILGGVGGGQLLNALNIGSQAGGLDLVGILTNIVGSGIGGGVLMAIVSFIKKLIKK